MLVAAEASGERIRRGESSSGSCQAAAGASRRKALFGEHSEPRCGNVPLTRTPNTTRGDAYAPRISRKPWPLLEGAGPTSKTLMERKYDAI